MRRALVLAVAVAAAEAALPAGATAADPGTWVQTGQLFKPAYYRQGIASNPKTGDVFFAGSFEGLYRTRNGVETAENMNAIPKPVMQSEGYNHIGDIAFDEAEGGRLLLPLESYAPFAADQNPSDTGSVGVVDPQTLRWEYYVKLDPAEIAKAMLFAVDAQQGLLWTLAGADLLAYNLADVNPANAAPNAAPIRAVKRLQGAVPDGAGGAVVFGGRLFLSQQVGQVNRVVSVDTTTGASRVEIELPGDLEAEGMDAGPYLGGLLHWELVPGAGLSSTQLFNFVPKGARLALKLKTARVRAGRRVGVTGTASVLTNGHSIPLEGVELRVAGKRARTDARGRATVRVKLTRGSYRAQAFFRGLRTASKKLRAT